MRSNKLKSAAGIVFSLLCFAGLMLFNSCQGEVYEHGRILYKNFCSNCHMDDGTGLVGVIPPLAGADFVRIYPEKLPCIIKKGMKGDVEVNGWTYRGEMPGVPQLTEFEITNIINYINTAWGNDFDIVKHESVREALRNCN